MMRLIFYWIIYFLFVLVHSQNLYIPINIKKAYEQNTRDYSGKPGPDYWQNNADYIIDVKFEPQTLLVKGKATIIYYNNSPQQLDHIVLHLYQDHFKKGNSRNRQVVASDLHDGIKIHSLSSSIDTISVINRAGTNLYAFLKNYLEPDDSIILKIKWEFTLPSVENQRFGKYNGGWFISLWYPQVSVYDDINGWDTYNFDWEQEFYNDFNNFKVNITVPRNHLVQATGTFINARETLHDNIYKRYMQSLETDSLIHIITQKDLDLNRITTKKKNITWKFEASKVCDFAFCVSKQYIWDGKTISINKEEKNKKIFVSSIYHPSSQDFKNEVTELAAKSIEYFSYEMPEITFPYHKMVVFNGAKGGMEYPMIVNNASSKKRYFTVILTSHEIAHSYFPFLTGINEKKYAWMDEGWAELLPLAFQQRTEPDFDFFEDIISSYETIAGKEDELVPMTPSVFYNENATSSYHIASYYRTCAAYYFLKDLLGEKVFKKALQEYILRWTGKHPLPYDFFFTFNNIAGEDLSWFWKPWFFERGYPDLALTKVKIEDDLLSFNVEKLGNIPVPVIIRIIYSDDSVDELQYSAAIWKEKSVFKQTKKIDREIKTITITHRHIPDAYKTNNTHHF